MKNIKKLVFAAIIFPIAIGTASAYAFAGKEHHQGPRAEFRMGLDRSMMRELDLTDTQKEQIKSIYKANKNEMKASYKNNFAAKQAQQQAFRKKINALLLTNHFDTAKANELAKHMSEMRISRQVAKLAKQHKILSILTPEQKTKFVELQQQRANERAEKMRHRMEKQDS